MKKWRNDFEVQEGRFKVEYIYIISGVNCVKASRCVRNKERKGQVFIGEK